MDSRRKDKYEQKQKRFQTHEPRTDKDRSKPRTATTRESNCNLSKKQVKLMANETLQIINDGFYINAQEEKVDLSESITNATKLTTEYNKIIDNDIKDSKNEIIDTEFSVELNSTLNICELYKEVNPCVLNFASAKNPGGGFQNGSMAQEESLAISTTMYEHIKNCSMYELNRNDPLNGVYHNIGIFTPNVQVIRNEEGELLNKPYKISIISIPAVNTSIASQYLDRKGLILSIAKRMNLMFHIAASNDIDVLILGSWGCGVFGGDIDIYAQLYMKLLTTKYENVFKEVIFATYSSEHIHVFESALSKHFQ